MKLEDIETKDNPVMYMPIAVSGSGKSTVLKAIQETNPDILVFSLDALRHKWYDANDYAKAYQLATEDDRFMGRAIAYFHTLVKQGKDMYIDNTNLSAKKRKKFLDAGRKNGMKLVAITFDVDLQTVLDRQDTRRDKTVPAGAVRQQWASLVPPQPGEFDEVVSSDEFTQNSDGNGISSSYNDTSSDDQDSMSSIPA